MLRLRPRRPVALPHAFIERCACCGGTEFESHAVLWPELVREWRLSADEAAYNFARGRPAGGACCFTVPVIVGRTSRSRAGLPPSFHGTPRANMADYRVETEYGADAWGHVIEAGSGECRIVAAEYPSALAFTAVKYQRPNLRYVHGLATAVPLPDAAVDLVVSFETIEQLRPMATHAVHRAAVQRATAAS